MQTQVSDRSGREDDSGAERKSIVQVENGVEFCSFRVATFSRQR